MITEHLITLIAALLLNGLLGGPRRWHALLGLRLPAQATVAMMKALERKLNRDKRPPQDLKKRGAIMALALLTVSAALGIALLLALKSFYWGEAVEIVLVASMLRLRQDADFANDVAQVAETKPIELAREELAGSSWRNAALLDVHGICRAAVETVAVHFADRVVAPAFWYALLGLPGIMVCRMSSALADTTGYGRDAFGAAALYIATAVLAMPSVLASLLTLAASTFLPFCQPRKTLAAFMQRIADVDYRKRQIAVFGTALDLSLGGPLSVYAGGPWIGGEVARATPKDARRAALLLWFSGFLLLLGLLLGLFLA